MAFYEDDDQLQQQDPNAIPAGQQTGGGSGLISGQGASPGSGATATPNAPNNPGNFVGIKQYLDANKSQSAKLGDQVAGQVKSSIDTAANEVGSLSSRFNQQANAGQIANIQGAGQEAQNITQQAATGQGLGQDQQQRFGEIANAEYKGPNNITEAGLYQPAYQAINKAQEYADLSKNESGNQALLRDIYKGAKYSEGENRLDSYLLNSGDNRQKLSQSRQDAQDLQGQFNAAAEGAEQYAKEQKALAESTAQAARQNLTAAQTARNAEVQARLDREQAGWRDEYNKYLNLLKNSNGGQNLNLTPEEAQRLGVSEGQKIYNLLNPVAGNTPEQYLTQQEFDPNRVISKDEQAQLSALDELAGTFGGALQNKYTQADLAGTLDKVAAFSADKFGMNARERENLFQTVDLLKGMVSSASKSDKITEQQQQSVTSYVEDTIRRVGGNWWNPFVWFETVTNAVTTILNIEVVLGNVNTSGETRGTIADYLSGRGGTYKDKGGTKSLNFGAALNPSYIVDSRADDRIDQLDREIQNETRANWAAQIEQYLRDAGYYNQIGGLPSTAQPTPAPTSTALSGTPFEKLVQPIVNSNLKDLTVTPQPSVIDNELQRLLDEVEKTKKANLV